MTQSRETQLQSIFINTPNVRNFGAALETLILGLRKRSRYGGEGRFMAVHSEAGMGKTFATVHFAAEKDAPYLAVKEWWRTSLTEFLRALAREVLQVKDAPKTKAECYTAVTDKLLQEDPLKPRPVFLDDAFKLTQEQVETCRELADYTSVPFVLVGEEKLLSIMKTNKRVWSRTFQSVAFEPVSPSDVIIYLKGVAGLALQEEDALQLQRRAQGDFRPVTRATLHLAQMARAQKTTAVTAEMMKTVLKLDIWGDAAARRGKK